MAVADLAVGTHLHGSVGSAEVIVVRAPSSPIEVLYSGQPLLAAGETSDSSATEEASGTGTQLGKRYVHDESGLELLCVKPGAGELTIDGAVLPLKSAKQLPASD
jgi:hypothetical protein